MILGMMTGTGAAVGDYWFFGPVAENGASGGSQLFYLRTQDPTNWSVPLRPTPAGLSQITRITSANGAIFMFGSVGQQVVSFNAGASWATCSGLTHDADLDVFWNGDFYYHNTSRSADGVSWGAIPNLPASTSIRLARQSDGAVIGWEFFTQYHVTVDNGANWTARSGFGTSAPDTMATDGSRIVFNTIGTGPRYSDDLMATFSSSGANTQYSAYHGGGGFVAKAFPQGLRDINDGATQGAITINQPDGSNEAANVWGANSIWAFASPAGGSPVLNNIYISTDGATTWTLEAGIYGGGQNICSTAQRP